MTKAAQEEVQGDEVVSVELPAPEGWKKMYTLDKSGTPQKNVIVFTSPTGEEIKNKKQLSQYIKSHPGGTVFSQFDWGTGDIPRRSSRLSEKAKAVETPESEPPKKAQKKSSSKKELDRKKDDIGEGKAKTNSEVEMLNLEDSSGDVNEGDLGANKLDAVVVEGSEQKPEEQQPDEMNVEKEQQHDELKVEKEQMAAEDADADLTSTELVIEDPVKVSELKPKERPVEMNTESDQNEEAGEQVEEMNMGKEQNDAVADSATEPGVEDAVKGSEPKPEEEGTADLTATEPELKEEQEDGEDKIGGLNQSVGEVGTEPEDGTDTEAKPYAETVAKLENSFEEDAHEKDGRAEEVEGVGLKKNSDEDAHEKDGRTEEVQGVGLERNSFEEDVPEIVGRAGEVEGGSLGGDGQGVVGPAVSNSSSGEEGEQRV